MSYIKNRCRARLVGLAGILSAVVGCSAARADLGGDETPGSTLLASVPPPSAPNPTQAPWKIVDRVDYVEAIGVGDGRLFWLQSAILPATGRCRGSHGMLSCETDNCAASVQHWPNHTDYTSWPAALARIGRQVLISDGQAYVSADNGIGLLSCPTSGCSAPVTNLRGAPINDFAIQGDSLYLVGGGVVARCVAKDCDNTVSPISLRNPAGVAPYTDGAQILADEEALYIVEESRVLRVPKDGSTAFTVIVPNIPMPSELAIDEENVYWVESQEQGAIRTCPKSGCVGEPRTLVQGLNYPRNLLVERENIYFMEPGGTVQGWLSDPVLGKDRLSRCSRAGCEQPTVLAENAGIGAERNLGCAAFRSRLVMDEHYLYFSACDPSLGPFPTVATGNELAVPGCGIAVVPK